MIEMKALTVRYGTFTALDCIDLTIQAGEAVAIVGESGAGKTTIAKVLLGLETPTAGAYTFDGADVARLKGKSLAAWRRKVQAVLQNPTASLNPRVRISVSVTEPITARGRLPREMVLRRAEALLESVGLDRALATRYPGELSGGQRQRVVIARALGPEPEMILLDEPVSALDASARAQILNLLSDLKARSGVTMVYITHDLATVGYLCERIVVLFAGLIMEDLPFERLLKDPDHPYTQALTAASQLPTTAQVDGSDEMPNRQAGCPFAPQCASAQDICRSSVPDLVELQPGWRSRCHFAGRRKPEFPTTRMTVPVHA